MPRSPPSACRDQPPCSGDHLPRHRHTPLTSLSQQSPKRIGPLRGKGEDTLLLKTQQRLHGRILDDLQKRPLIHRGRTDAGNWGRAEHNAAGTDGNQHFSSGDGGRIAGHGQPRGHAAAVAD